MIRALLVLVSLVAAPALHAAVTQPALYAQDGDLPDKRPEIKEKIAELAGLTKGRGEKDTEAIAVIDQLLQEFPKSGPKDQKDIIGALDDVFGQRRQELESGEPNNPLFIAAAAALGEMGVDASSVLVKWIGDKRHRSDLTLQRRLILSLGKTKDPKRVRDLVGMLQNKDAILVAATAEAMANYSDADGEMRKELFSELLKILMSAKGRMDSDVNDLEARQRYDTIAAPMVTSMQTLSRHDERVPEEWQRWWNKNKKADWDKEQGA